MNCKLTFDKEGGHSASTDPAGVDQEGSTALGDSSGVIAGRGGVDQCSGPHVLLGSLASGGPGQSPGLVVPADRRRR